jgi:hypothetical protein
VSRFPAENRPDRQPDQHGSPPAAAAASSELGHQRAAAGVSLDGARTDLSIAVGVARVSATAAAAMIDALTMGWFEEFLGQQFSADCVDPLTELASPGYLRARMRELYAESAWRGTSVGATHALVVVRLAPVADRLEGETQMILAQTALHSAFPGGETLARAAPNCAVGLTPRHEPWLSRALREVARELQLARDEHRLRRYEVRVETLPDTLRAACELLDQLG